ncbi:MAG: SUMF1/EgtB/PvdO family nonheme iron enzyme [Verrucomicrobiia bacterium]
MNRVRLLAFAAALSLSNPAVLCAAEKTLTTSTGMELVWIPPGEFLMGSTDEERRWATGDEGNIRTSDLYESGEPQRTVMTNGFWMGRTEVTVGQWRKFADSGYLTDGEKQGGVVAPDPETGKWGLVKGACWRNPSFGFSMVNNHPACCISWNDAVAFCQWLTETEKKAGKLPAGMEYRLPTEAEWEYACRAGTQTKFWWGDRLSAGKDRINTGDKHLGFQYISPADTFGAKGRNAFGLADMLGNVWEWCSDAFDPKQAHPKVYGNAVHRTLRGGSFHEARGYLRCAARYRKGPTDSFPFLGMRACCGVTDISGPSGANNASSVATAPQPPAAGTETKAGAMTEPRLADPELQKDSRKFARNQSSIKGLYVVRTDAGLRVGGAQDIIATIERVSGDRETICDFVSDVAKDTQISMEEAERLLKVRHPVWQAGHKIRFSYSNKYTKQAGGSAGGAFSVLLLSLLDGMQIDPGFAMTGDVTVDGKIREVGAVAEKLRGALLDKCRVVAIPDANEENLNDLAVLYSPAMLWSMQILSITTLDDAAAVARTDRAANLAKAMELFGQVQRSLPTSATVYALRNPAVVQTLRQVLQLAPNHSSAEYMLRVANNQLPATLSLGGSLDEIWAAPGPLLGFLFADYKEPEKSKRYYFDKVPSGAFKAAMDRLNWLQFRLHPKTRDLKMAMVDYMISLDQLHRQSAFSSGTLRLHLTKRDKVLSEAHLLGTDRKTLEEMMH